MLLDRLEEQPPDALIALIALAEADPRPDKIDVGVGVYRDAAGNTPILRASRRPSAAWSRPRRPNPISARRATSASPS